MMIGIKTTSITLLLILLIAPTITLFPNPKKSHLEATPLKLTTHTACTNFELHIQSDKIMEFMPHSLDNKLESAPGQYYFEKVMDRIRRLSKCVENG